MNKHFSEKLEKAGTVDFEKHPAQEGWAKVQGSVDPRFAAGLPFPVPQMLEFKAFRNSGNFFQQFSRDFPGIFLGNARADPRNSHSLLEFSEFCEQTGRKAPAMLACNQKRSGDPNPQYFSKVLPYKWGACCRTNGRRTAVQMGGVLQGIPLFEA